MTHEDIIRMARSAIRLSINDSSLTEFDAEKTIIDKAEFLYWFAKEVSANEREACAKVCETQLSKLEHTDKPYNNGVRACAATIRARDEK